MTKWIFWTGKDMVDYCNITIGKVERLCVSLYILVVIGTRSSCGTLKIRLICTLWAAALWRGKSGAVHLWVLCHMYHSAKAASSKHRATVVCEKVRRGGKKNQSSQRCTLFQNIIDILDSRHKGQPYAGCGFCSYLNGLILVSWLQFQWWIC